LFDAHEYSPSQATFNLKNVFLFNGYRKGLIRRFSNRSDAMITVSEGIRDLYKKRFNLDSKIILNAADYVENDYIPVNKNSIKIVHHGTTSRQRFIHEIIKLFDKLDDRFYLYLHLLPSDQKYFQYLKKLAKKTSGNRIFFCDVIEPGDITKYINKYDLGIHLLKDINLNHKNALPNKFFDYIMAGLGVIIYPTNMMRDIIQYNNIGVVADNFSYKSLANKINGLSSDNINEYKKNSLKLAKTLNSNIEGRKLIKIYKSLLS